MTCTATGGTLSTSSLTGPGLGSGGLQLQAEGRIGRTGQNTYFVTSDTLLGQSNGDTYTCRAMNNVSSPMSSVVLEGMILPSSSPIILAGMTVMYLLPGSECYTANVDKVMA